MILYILGSSDDFAPIAVSRTFQSNSDSPLCFSMSVNDDTIVEGDETFVISLSSPDTPSNRLGTVVIIDDDGTLQLKDMHNNRIQGLIGWRGSG